MKSIGLVIHSLRVHGALHLSHRQPPPSQA